MTAKKRKRRDRFSLPLDIAVVTLSDWGGPHFSLANDLRRVKAALLYADSVRLFSHLPALLLSFQEAERSSPQTLVEFLAVQTDEALKELGLADGHGEANPRSTRRVVRTSVAGRAQESRTSAALARLGDASTSRSHVSKILKNAGAEELEQLLDAGLVVVDGVGLELTSIGDELPEEYASALSEVIGSPTSYPLFDENTSVLITDLMETGKLVPSSIALKHAVQVATGTGLIARLPVFPDAQLDDILAARDELKSPLDSYREAVAEFSTLITSAATDPSLEADLDDLYRGKVQHRLDQLHEGLRGTKVAAEAAKTMGKDLASWKGASISLFTIATVDRDFVDLGPAVSGLAGVLLATALTSLFDARDKSKSDSLYYLLELDKRLR